MSGAVNRQKAESELEEFDSVLDYNTRAFFHLVDGYKWHPQKNINESAEAINKVLDKYGLGIVCESYATQSSLTPSLLADMAASESAKQLRLLSGCAELVAGIAKAHDLFQQNYVNYQQQISAESNDVSATEIRKPLC